tara:strand:- start:2946 stop:3209 length:264 start_codon:yes stop_codon:yes gene_type:complete
MPSGFALPSLVRVPEQAFPRELRRRRDRSDAPGLRHDPEAREYYYKKKTEGDHHKEAIFDLVHKNLRRIVAVWVDQKEFEPRREKTA